MLKLLKAFFLFDRRKQSEPVAVERRKDVRMSRQAAAARLDASIDRFNRTVIRKREDLCK